MEISRSQLISLIPEDELTSIIQQLAQAIDQDYKGTDALVVIGVLKGSFVFLADLIRAIQTPLRAIEIIGEAVKRIPDTVLRLRSALDRSSLWTF